ncbi:helix-turn-helix domain-containing protein [Chitinophaga sp. Hz27]|uniref:helix-turn-helix domain-containing protein n=1 Tax=Chitinophaga sp. Hz27 TaxID=3347169 RepID=UPI0035DDD2D9
MTFTGVFTTILLLGTLQGFILSALLFITPKNKRANKFLALLLLLLALASLNLFFFTTGILNKSPLLAFIANFIPLIITMPVGPLLYCYVRSSMESDFQLSKQQRLHFVTTILDIVPQLTALVYVTGVLTNTIRNNPQPWGAFIDQYDTFVDIPRWLSISTYIWLSLRYLRQPMIAVNPKIKWFRQFLYIFLAFQAIWLLYLIPYVIPSMTNFMLDTIGWYPVYIPIVALIYTLGIRGYLLPPQELVANKKIAVPPADTVAAVVPLLEKAMEQDLVFLNPNLDLATLSQHTGIPAKTISAVLNQHLKKSFATYINQYRVSIFQQKILAADFEHMTIMGVAYESGFNSQATFQRTFKQITGISPKEYIQQQGGRSATSLEN